MKLSWRSLIASLLITVVTGMARANLPGTVLIRRGTSMQFETEKPIDPATANRGDDVPLRLIRPLAIDGTTVLAAGFEAHGKVMSKPEVKSCTGESVQWGIDRIRMPNGSTALVQKMFVPRSGVIPDLYDRQYLEARGLKRVERDLAEVPVSTLFVILDFICLPFGCVTAPFLPQQGAGLCAGPGPDMSFPAIHSFR